MLPLASSAARSRFAAVSGRITSWRRRRRPPSLVELPQGPQDVGHERRMPVRCRLVRHTVCGGDTLHGLLRGERTKVRRRTWQARKKTPVGFAPPWRRLKPCERCVGFQTRGCAWAVGGCHHLQPIQNGSSVSTCVTACGPRVDVTARDLPKTARGFPYAWMCVGPRGGGYRPRPPQNGSWVPKRADVRGLRVDVTALNLSNNAYRHTPQKSDDARKVRLYAALGSATRRRNG